MLFHSRNMQSRLLSTCNDQYLLTKVSLAFRLIPYQRRSLGDPDHRKSDGLDECQSFGQGIQGLVVVSSEAADCFSLL